MPLILFTTLLSITAILSVGEPQDINIHNLPVIDEMAGKSSNLPSPCELDVVLCPDEDIETLIRSMGGEYSDYLVKLSFCESSLNPKAISNTGDYGLFQINLRWNPDVTYECAMNPRCATEWTISQIEMGNQWKWVCDSKI